MKKTLMTISFFTILALVICISACNSANGTGRDVPDNTEPSFDNQLSDEQPSQKYYETREQSCSLPSGTVIANVSFLTLELNEKEMEDEAILVADFDKDGINDCIFLCEDEDYENPSQLKGCYQHGNKYVVAYLSALENEFCYFPMPEFDGYTLKYNSGVFSIYAGFLRNPDSNIELQFKYDPQINTLRLIKCIIDNKNIPIPYDTPLGYLDCRLMGELGINWD